MNYSELAAKLKRVPLPARSAEYWEDFPSRIRVQLPREQRVFRPHNAWRPRLQWAGGLALALGLIWFGERFHPLQTASSAITKHEQLFRSQVAQVESGLRLLMFNPHGMGYLLAEAN
jgi:hypothetical protein